jgi:hypothetical protein
LVLDELEPPPLVDPPPLEELPPPLDGDGVVVVGAGV